MHTIHNPYLTAYEQIVNSKDGRFSHYDARRALVKQYAWAIPNDEAIKALVALSPLVEVGAGSGYWAALIRQAGGVIRAFDSPVGQSAYSFDAKHSPISVGSAHIAGHYPNYTLFLCWPPYDNPFAYDALTAHRKAGGQRLAYVGEGSYGCTGDADFHKLISQAYEHIETIRLPQWEGIHDSLTIYERKV